MSIVFDIGIPTLMETSFIEKKKVLGLEHRHILSAKPITKIHTLLVIAFFNSFNLSLYGSERNFLVSLHAVVEICAY
jgi:hypothetical protein